MPPRIVQPDDASIAEAVALLRRGEVVALPTETVYGLGADTFNTTAIRRVYELKGRPADNPLIAHVHDVDAVRSLVQAWSAQCDELAHAFWPGPLTLVVTKSTAVPVEATAGLDTIAVRCPNHPVTQQLLEQYGGAISAPSANRSGHVSPTTAHHVAAEFSDCADLLILDGGPCALGIESTVVDMTGAVPRVLRPGSVTAEQLRDVLGEIESPTVNTQTASPGTSPAHYAPRTPAALAPREDLLRIIAEQSTLVIVLCSSSVDVPPPHKRIVMPVEPEAYAARLYSAMREADALSASLIIIERPEQESGQWQAIHDRLRRATTAT